MRALGRVFDSDVSFLLLLTNQSLYKRFGGARHCECRVVNDILSHLKGVSCEDS